MLYLKALAVLGLAASSVDALNIPGIPIPLPPILVPILNNPLILHQGAPYSIFGSGKVVSQGNTRIYGRVGVSTGNTVTGLNGPGIAKAIDRNTLPAILAKADILAASLSLKSLVGGAAIPGSLGGRTLNSGKYTIGSTTLTGTLTLDAKGNKNAGFLIKVNGDFKTAANSRIVLLNGASGCHVIFQVTGSAILGANSLFGGVILSEGAIVAQNGAYIAQGALFSLNNAVFLTNNLVTPRGACGNGLLTSRDPESMFEDVNEDQLVAREAEAEAEAVEDMVEWPAEEEVVEKREAAEVVVALSQEEAVHE